MVMNSNDLKKNISERLNNLSDSQTLVMTQMSRDMRAQGIDVINLSIGEPDFDTPNHIKEAAKKAIDENFTHYPPVAGFPDLKEAISSKFKRENNLDYATNQIIVSNGAKHSIANVILSIVNKDEEVIIPAPYWVSYIEIVKIAEGIPVIINAGMENDFKITPEQIKNAITEKTKAIFFNSPSNPTGTVYSKDEIKAIADVLADYSNIFILSDEIYEHIVFEGKHESIAQFNSVKDRVITINGVSKGYAMTGWRIGYIGAAKCVVDACNKIQGQCTSGANTIAQKASVAALNSDNSFSIEMKNTFNKRRDLVLNLIEDIPGLACNKPNGAFYVFPDASYYFGKSFENYKIKDDSALCIFLLEVAHVAIVPGCAFGAPKNIRLSYAASEKDIKEAMKRIKNALALLV